MLSLLFLLLNLLLCFYFIVKRNAAILGYLIFFQEIHLIPFHNLGLNVAGYFYYTFISMAFFVSVTKLKLSKERIIYLLNNKVLLSLVILTFIILIHVFIIGLKSEGAQLLISRYFLQIIPAIIFLIFVLKREQSLYQLSYGILIYGVFLVFILVFTTDIFNMIFRRSDFREVIGMNPIAVSRTGGIVFITALFLLMDKKLGKYRSLFVLALIISVFMAILGMSRGPILALVLSLFLFFLIKRGSFTKKIFNISIAVVLLFAVGIFINSYFDFDTLYILIDRFESLQNYENMRRYRRLELAADFLKNNFTLFSTYLWFGMGPDGFAYYFGTGYVHNLIVEFVLEYGFLGIISVAMFSIYSFYFAFRIIRSRVPLRYSYISVIFIFLYISAMVSGDLIANRNLLFVAITQVIFIYFLKKLGYKIPRLSVLS